MTDSARLGGFKVLKNAARISLVSPRGKDYFPLALFRSIAENKINLPYLTIVSHQGMWGINLVVDGADEERAALLIRGQFGKTPPSVVRSAVISVFPHKRNPEISGKLLHAFDRQGVEPDALASSPSAISVVVQEERLPEASNALFEPFSFGAYRTPEDWKLAQRGKEKVFKEVVASYQEKKPGVYGLEYELDQELVQVGLRREKMAKVGSSFMGLDCSGLHLAFLATSPCTEPSNETLSFCLPSSQGYDCKGAISRISPRLRVDSVSPVTTFSMNGPHFGDRYGIACELLEAMASRAVSLLALSCTVASISGVVPQEQSDAAIHAIQDCFDVPSVTRKE